MSIPDPPESEAYGKDAPVPSSTGDPAPARTTSSGLGVEQLRKGDGGLAQPGHEVVVHYVGTLTDGTVFDSSRDRSAPFVFGLGKGHVIRGFEEGVTGMRVGEIRRLTIPPDLGYGAAARGTIPANATLVFEIELLDVR